VNSTKTTTLRPNYVARFRCLGSDCEDTCCAGWDVVIDRATYERYRTLPACRIKPDLDRHIARNENATGDADMAIIAMDPVRGCPLLSEKRLCTIQLELGTNYLPVPCDVFPRARNMVDGELEMSLSLACPEAARLTLLDPEPMQFERVERSFPIAGSIPTLSSADTPESTKPYRHFHAVRELVIDLLQNRDYPLWQRLLALGEFCQRLEAIPPARYDCDVTTLIETFRNLLADEGIEGLLTEYKTDLGAQAQVVTLLLDHLFNNTPRNERFAACYHTFNQGLNRSPGSSPYAVNACWRESAERYFRPFISNHEYLFENFLVSYAFRTLFPFGPQISLTGEQRPIFGEYLLMVAHYTLLQGLLIGMAGYLHEALRLDHCVQLFQSYSKVAAHNLTFHRTALQFLEACQMNSMAGVAILIDRTTLEFTDFMRPETRQETPSTL
jgi:lysine-N-methylase